MSLGGRSISSTASLDYSQYYSLEEYLFDVVSPRFSASKTLSPFDFFCIVIWKANRSKSKIAQRLLRHGDGYESLDSAVQALMAAIRDAVDDKARLSVLVRDWGFRLPMASAILTVLYPTEFTVYDIRVCEVLADFEDAQHKTDFNSLWTRYAKYVERVRRQVPEVKSLRDKDRFLWGKSFALQLQKNIAEGFGREADNSDFET